MAKSLPSTDVSPDSSLEIPTLVRVNPLEPGYGQRNIHTRYHPDIPCVATIEEGQAFKVECLDYSGGQVHNNDCADDVLELDHDRDHHLSGPFLIPSARPGDVLAIEILDIQPFIQMPWGYSVTAPGMGPLDRPNEPTLVTKSIWDFAGTLTSSRHIPHVSFQGKSHPGILATAPSHELLARWVEREASLGVDAADPPKERGAYVGQDLLWELREKIYREGARTAPGRENGGNTDISSLVRGSKLFLPVFVPGAKLSVGDLHFSQSESEPTTAIEMAGIVTLRVNVVKQQKGDSSFAGAVVTPTYIPSIAEPMYRRQIVFTGLSLDDKGKQHNMCGISSYRMAAWNAMNYLIRFGYTFEQVYMLLAAAPIECKVVATANRPNFVVSVGLPLDIFHFDISPPADGIIERRVIAGPALTSGRVMNGHGH